MAPKGGIRQRLGGDAVGASEELAGDAAGSSDVPRGGVRSRLDRKRGRDEEESSAHLPMVVSMKKDWGKGKVTSAQVQEYVWGAVAQGARGMDKLAAAGGSGKNPQNMQRALISAFGMPMGAPRFTWIEIPTKAGRVAHPFFVAAFMVFCVVPPSTRALEAVCGRRRRSGKGVLAINERHSHRP